VHVLIIAHDAVLRRACAEEFHRASVLRSGPLVGVDCATQEDLLERSLLGWSVHTLDRAAHPLWAAARGTLVLDRVTWLSAANQKRLHDYLRRVDIAGAAASGFGRLISMCEAPPEDAVERGEFSAPLLDCLDKVRVTPGADPCRGAA
jgi:DNA-binding NtrC family response regulator